LSNSPVSPENDRVIAEEAYSKLRAIFSEYYGSALLEAGEYIYRNFYGSSIQAVKEKSPIKETSFRKLCDILGQNNDGAPSRSWLNNAVRLHVDVIEFEQHSDIGTVQTFG
jgi:hypothetical protein